MGRTPAAKQTTVQLGGAPWTVKYGKIGGCWGITIFDDKVIKIDPATKRKGNHREIVIHEFLHALMPYLDEEIVAAAGKELDDALDALDI